MISLWMETLHGTLLARRIARRAPGGSQKQPPTIWGCRLWPSQARGIARRHPGASSSCTSMSTPGPRGGSMLGSLLGARNSCLSRNMATRNSLASDHSCEPCCSEVALHAVQHPSLANADLQISPACARSVKQASRFPRMGQTRCALPQFAGSSPSRSMCHRRGGSRAAHRSVG